MAAAVWLALGIGGAPDMIGWLGLGEVLGGLQGASLGIMLIALVQGLNLSREHIVLLGRADRLNVELAERVAALEASNREIRTLYTELRYQIERRSQQLVATLARGDTVPPDGGSLEPGDIVGERYRVIRAISAGAMGAVYEVVRLTDERRFALKVLLPTMSGPALARLAREAEVISHIDHPNVVAIVDVSVSHTGRPFVVMELVEGGSLDAERARCADVGFALQVLLQVAKALEAIHALGIVHRDLKPGNVILTQGPGGGPLAKLADFGVASRVQLEAGPPGEPRRETAERASELDDASLELAATLVPEPVARTSADSFGAAAGGDRSSGDAALTHASGLCGTPQYMAPEAARGMGNDPAADIFSYGVMAFELLGRCSPYDDLPVLAAGDGRLLPLAVQLGEICPTLPARLVSVIERCVSMVPALRPTAAELAQVLGQAIEEGAARPAASGA
jgi:serine/threonine-protein kinase